MFCDNIFIMTWHNVTLSNISIVSFNITYNVPQLSVENRKLIEGKVCEEVAFTEILGECVCVCVYECVCVRVCVCVCVCV